MESNSNLNNGGNNFPQENVFLVAAGTAIVYDNKEKGNGLKFDPSAVVESPENSQDFVELQAGDFHDGQLPPGLQAEIEKQGEKYRNTPGTERFNAVNGPEINK